MMSKLLISGDRILATKHKESFVFGTGACHIVHVIVATVTGHSSLCSLYYSFIACQVSVLALFDWRGETSKVFVVGTSVSKIC